VALPIIDRKEVISMPSKYELGPNDRSKNPEIRPGQIPLKDDTAAKRGALGNLAGKLAVKNASKDKSKK
jgi:hypothetical protein